MAFPRNRLNGTIPFTLENGRYHTAIGTGFAHQPGQADGSFLDLPIHMNADGTGLWLERVIDKHGTGGWQPEPLWLVWYDAAGNPTQTQSGTFDLNHLRTILTSFIR